MIYIDLYIIYINMMQSLIVKRYKLMKKNSVLCLVFILISCATQGKYQKRLDTWLGHSENELVSSLGIPNGSYEREINNKKVKYLTYNSTRNQYIPNGNHIGPGLNGNFVGKHCTTSFAIEDDKIVSWKYDGNDCVAN